MTRVHSLAALALLLAPPGCSAARDEKPPQVAQLSLEEPVKRPPSKHDLPANGKRGADVGASTGAVDEKTFKALHELRTDAPPALKGQAIPLAGGSAYLSLPEGQSAPMPGLVVIQEWWGLNDNVKHWADRLAAEGYAALAVDLYGGKIATNPEDAMAYMQEVDPARATEIVRAAHRFLVEDERVKAPRTGSIGWCFGGHWSLRLAMVEPDLDACVIYYGRPILDVEQLRPIKAAVLGIFGSKDASISGKTVEELGEALTRAGVRNEMNLYPAEHAFANPSSARYDEANAALAWARTRAFLAEHLKTPSLR